MIALHPDRLEWRDDDSDSEGCRLFFDGRASNVVKRHTGAIVRDTFPTDVIELKDDGILHQALGLELAEQIRTVGSRLIHYKSPEVLRNEAFKLADYTETSAEQNDTSSSLSHASGGFNMPSMGPLSKGRPGHNKTKISIKKASIAGAVVLALCFGGIAGANALFSKDQEIVETTNSLNIVGTTTSKLGELDQSLPVSEVPTGWGKEAKWKFGIRSSSIAVSGFQVGVVLCDGKSVTILDPETGSTIISVEGNGVPKMIATAVISDTVTAIIWRIGDILYVWNPDINQVQYYKLSADSIIETSGTGALVKHGSESFIVSESGLKKIQNANGKEIAADGQNIIVSSGWNGPITLRTPEGETFSESLIQPPRSGMIVNQWHGAGNGIALISWKTSKTDTKKDSEKVVLSSHKLDSGEVLGQVDTTISEIKGQRAKYGGANIQVAVGPFLFSIESGSLLADASGDVSSFILVLGDHAYGKKKDGGVLTYIDGKRQDRLTPNTPITILSDGSSIARVAPETIARLPKQ